MLDEAGRGPQIRCPSPARGSPGRELSQEQACFICPSVVTAPRHPLCFLLRAGLLLHAFCYRITQKTWICHHSVPPPPPGHTPLPWS